MIHRRAALGMVLPAALLALAGCDLFKPAEGKSCNARTDGALCTGQKTRLSCEGGTWMAEACLGPKGCSESGNLVSCDTTIANEGARCGERGDVSCTPDRKTMLLCRDGKWAATDRCLGPDGCRSTEASVECDTTVGIEGDICTPAARSKKVAYVCTSDGKAVLTCSGGKWRKVESCTGPKGCSGSRTIECDHPTASPGDFCVKEEKDDDHACSPDRKARLECGPDGWKVESKCLGEKGCSDSGTDIECDDSVQEPGSPCDEDDEGSAVCSTDKKTILECKDGKLVKSRTCPGACKVGAEHVDCE